MLKMDTKECKLTHISTLPIASTLVSSPLWEFCRYMDMSASHVASTPDSHPSLTDTTSHPPSLVNKILDAMTVILKALVEYGVDQVAMSFNGGKDCTVLLHVMVAALELYYSIDKQPDTKEYALLHTPPLTTDTVAHLLSHWKRDKAASPSDFPCITTLYVSPEHPFIEIQDFVQVCRKRYHLTIHQYPAPMQQALGAFLDTTRTKAILLGTRKTDPYSDHLQTFHPTDASWPSVMRVHPILTWSYADIWSFILDLRIPYCCLYDQGFTSLGGQNNTQPTECLRNPQRACGYDPAYYLLDETLERQGRIK